MYSFASVQILTEIVIEMSPRRSVWGPELDSAALLAIPY